MVRSGQPVDARQKALAASRLPWIDEVNRRESSLKKSAGWLISAALLVMAGAYLLAVRTFHERPAPHPSVTTPLGRQTATGVSKRSTNITASLAYRPNQERRIHQSAGRVQAAQAQSAAGAASGLKPVAVATRSTSSAAKQVAAGHSALAASEPQRAVAGVISSPPHRGAVLPTVANAAVVESARVPRPAAASELNGHLVQLGAFSTLDQAKPAWRAMERSYPALKQFEASLIENRDWNGRALYQFQVGTASQADSEMLCQSLQHLNFRCAVVARPWRS